MTITLIADDLTGACDAGAHFTGQGSIGVFVDAKAIDARLAVAVIDTESRALPPTDAGQRVRDVAGQLAPERRSGFLFKKIDSTLRGPIAAELDALLDETGRAGALVCPSFPVHGRTVTEGCLHVDGRPAHRTAIGRDPAYPGDTSDVALILRRGAARPVHHVPLATVRAGGDALYRELTRAAGRLLAADAETDADLASLATAAIAHDLVLAGSAGLAHAAAACLGHAGVPVEIPRGRGWLIVAGSLHPASRAQIRALVAAGVAGAFVEPASAAPPLGPLAARLADGQPVFLATPDADDAPAEARRSAGVALAAAAARLIERARPDVLAVTGGDTAHAVMTALGADRLELVGAPTSGLALGQIAVGTPRPVTWLSKAGGFGGPDLFVDFLGGHA